MNSYPKLAIVSSDRGPLVVADDGDNTALILGAATDEAPLVKWLRTSAAELSAAIATARENPSQRIALAQAQFLAYAQPPGKVVCLGLNYAAHAAEGGSAPPTYPSVFLRSATSLVGAGEPMVLPKASALFDFEAELLVVVGQRCKDLTEEAALDFVAGYSCFNDGSLRDFQRKSDQWTMGKNFDATGAVGPWFVPASALPRGAVGLKIESRLNGQVMQSSNTEDMIFSVARTMCILSEVMTLEAGDLIAMGTPSGVGYARNPPVWMRQGDCIEVEIEGIGILKNPIRSAAG